MVLGMAGLGLWFAADKFTHGRADSMPARLVADLQTGFAILAAGGLVMGLLRGLSA